MTLRYVLRPVLRWIAPVLLLVLSSAPLAAQPTRAGSGARVEERRVLVISVDGLRPDVLLRSDAPNIRGLMQRGCFTMWAESTDLAITLPTHVSMLTGRTPAHHHIDWNDDRPVPPGALNVPTLFDLARKQGLSTAMVAAKDKLGILAGRSVERLMLPGRDAADASAVAARAAGLLRGYRPRVMFVHFADPDAAGHAEGWGGAAQLAAVARVDRGVGQLLTALKDAGLDGRTLVILTADHGGSGRSHGAAVPYSRYIPWIAAGPGVRENHDLTLERDPAVHVEDVFATALDFLGMAIPAGTDGRPLRAIYGGPRRGR